MKTTQSIGMTIVGLAIAAPAWGASAPLAEQCEPHWDNTIGEPGVNGTSNLVSALAVFDDGSGAALYAGGVFTFAGGVEVNGIAKWDGELWSPLSSGVKLGPTTTGWVRSLAVFDDGSGAALYAGGVFTFAGGVEVNGIAKWDGEKWHDLEGGVGIKDGPGLVLALEVYDDGSGPALYAGGQFTTAGGIETKHIAKWDGLQWSSLAGGIDGDSGAVRAMAVFDGGTGAELYVGGNSVQVDGIGRWDGESWSGIGGGGGAHALTVFNDGSGPALYVGGDFIFTGGLLANRIARWDGAQWSALGSGMSSQVHSLVGFDDGSGPLLYAGGAFTSAGDMQVNGVAKWDGSQWSGLGDQCPAPPWRGCGLSGTVSTLLAFDTAMASTLYIGGNFTSAGGDTAIRIAAWQGCAPFTSAEIFFDIRPGSCPNPLNLNSQGILPAAIVGTPDFDVSLIDHASIMLRRADGVGGSVVPLNGPPGPGIEVGDVATPLEQTKVCDCHDLDGDGIDDLLLKFNVQDLVAEFDLGSLVAGQALELVIEGQLSDGTSFHGSDCVHGVGGAMPQLLTLLGSWGECEDDCFADLNGDGRVDLDDLLILIANWNR